MEIPILENPANLILKLTNYVQYPTHFFKVKSPNNGNGGPLTCPVATGFTNHPGDRIRSIVVAYCVIPICINWRFPKSLEVPPNHP